MVLKTFGTVVDANLFRAHLEAYGIEACVPEEYTPQIFWNVIPSPLESVTVRVAAKDYEAAKAILAVYVITARTATPGVSQLENDTLPGTPAIPLGADESPSKICVSCRAAIPASSAICPKCQWTQPDVT
jgi:hypothetical protein